MFSKEAKHELYVKAIGGNVPRFFISLIRELFLVIDRGRRGERRKAIVAGTRTAKGVRAFKESAKRRAIF